MPTRSPAAARGAAIVVLLCALGLAAPSAGIAAQLVGGSTQRAIARAFTAKRSHRGQVIVSIRASSVARSWAVVRSVTPQRVGQTKSGATPVLNSTYYHLVGRGVRPGPPPGAVRRDLAHRFAVVVVYRGAGAESISYLQSYRSGCQGQGGFDDSASDIVTPMSWTVRYVVDLDDVLSAVRGAAGTAVVANVSFDAAGSRIDASETVSRTLQDVGCNQNASTVTCTTAFTAGGLDPGGQVSFPAGSGLEVGLPLAPRQQGACNPDNFTLGPSLWAAGGATALVSGLQLLGGTLPAHPYRPIHVSWPQDAATTTQGFALSPCQGDDGTVCGDSFTWQGTVALQAVPGT
jgi:F0F1-type ATP synthase membrane subunit c/vacuolar-type H+-ATPase subunit K